MERLEVNGATILKSISYLQIVENKRQREYMKEFDIQLKEVLKREDKEILRKYYKAIPQAKKRQKSGNFKIQPSTKPDD